MRSFKSNENIHKKEDGSYYVVYSLLCSIHLLHVMHQNINKWLSK